MYMTKTQMEKLEKAKSEVLKNPPTVVKNMIVKIGKTTKDKSSHEILMEMRYGS